MLNRLSTHWSSARGPALLPYLVASPLLVDITDIFGRFYFPNALVRVACGGLPFTGIAQPLIPHRLIDFAIHRCTEAIVSEPTFSIIFFVFKLMLVIIFNVCLLINMAVHFDKLRQKQFEAIEKDGGILGHLKNAGFTVVGLALFCWYIFLQFDAPPSAFRIDLLAKFYEDFYALMLLITMMGMTSMPVALICYSFEHAKSLSNPKS